MKKPKIRTRTYPSGRKSYQVDEGTVPKGDGSKKRPRKSFSNKKDAEAYATEAHKARLQHGLNSHQLTPQQRVEADAAFRQLESLGVSLPDAIQCAVKHIRPYDQKRLISDIVEDVLASMRLKGCKTRSIREAGFKFKKIVDAFSGRFLNEIEASEIETWVHGLAVADLTKSSYIRYLNIIFQHGVNHNFCADNIVSKVPKPRITRSAPPIFSPTEAWRLLLIAQRKKGGVDRQGNEKDCDLLPYLAIGLFAGLRSSELEKLDWADVRLGSGTIHVNANIAKTSQHRHVEISPNLKAWLSRYPQLSGPIVFKGWRDRLQKLAKSAEVDWKQNGMRHSCASYHLAFHQNSDKTAFQLGHSKEVLYRNYNNAVTPDAAKQYWNIYPQSGGILKMPGNIPEPTSGTANVA